MPPTPKPAGQKQRRNRSATATTLRVIDGLAVPPLPELPAPDGDPTVWHPLTVSWWADIWTSPMAPEFLAADVHGLYLLAALVDQFWHEPTKEIAAEIRLQRQCFGLSPIDRRRLEWHIEQGEQAAVKTASRRTSPRGRKDPRDALAAS